MDEESEKIGELTHWIRRLHSEDPAERAEARDRVIKAFRHSLALQIRKKLQGTEKHRVRESDLCQEVWKEFFGRSYEAKNSESLGALLSEIVDCKVINSRRYNRRLKRSVELEASLDNDSDSSSRHGMDNIAAQARLPAERFNPNEERSSEPVSEEVTDDSFFGEPLEQLISGATPEDAAVALGEFNLLLSFTEQKPDLETILYMSLNGHTTDEIAQVLNSTKRTVERKKALLRQRFEEHKQRNQQ